MSQGDRGYIDASQRAVVRYQKGVTDPAFKGLSSFGAATCIVVVLEGPNGVSVVHDDHSFDAKHYAAEKKFVGDPCELKVMVNREYYLSDSGSGSSRPENYEVAANFLPLVQRIHEISEAVEYHGKPVSCAKMLNKLTGKSLNLGAEEVEFFRANSFWSDVVDVPILFGSNIEVAIGDEVSAYAYRDDKQKKIRRERLEDKAGEREGRALVLATISDLGKKVTGRYVDDFAPDVEFDGSDFLPIPQMPDDVRVLCAFVRKNFNSSAKDLIPRFCQQHPHNSLFSYVRNNQLGDLSEKDFSVLLGTYGSLLQKWCMQYEKACGRVVEQDAAEDEKSFVKKVSPKAPPKRRHRAPASAAQASSYVETSRAGDPSKPKDGCCIVQ